MENFEARHRQIFVFFFGGEYWQSGNPAAIRSCERLKPFNKAQCAICFPSSVGGTYLHKKGAKETFFLEAKLLYEHVSSRVPPPLC